MAAGRGRHEDSGHRVPRGPRPIADKAPPARTGADPVTDIATLLHIVLVIAALAVPIIVGVRVLEGPSSDLYAWRS